MPLLSIRSKEYHDSSILKSKGHPCTGTEGLYRSYGP